MTDENWYVSCRKKGDYICKDCQKEQSRSWVKANLEKHRADVTRNHRKNGQLPMSENKDCGVYLGICVAEGLVRHYFKDVETMPYGNPGFDFICNKGMKVDVKSACLGVSGNWIFHIEQNKTADFFFCMAFDSLEGLNLLYAWMIPGEVVNHLTLTSISPSTVSKWDEYRINIDGIVSCCGTMKTHELSK